MNIAIVGGGAAGIMCAASLLESDREDLHIDLFEKNKTLGVKVAISGGGRCNVTTGIFDPQLLVPKYIRGGKFLLAAMQAFPPDKVMSWYESHGVPLKVEDDNRVFPVSDVGQDVVDVFVKLFADPRIAVHFMEGITDISPVDHKFHLKTAKAEYDAEAVVLTTGGNAYRHTGSTGDGYAFAKVFNHTLTPLGPSLNSFEVADEWCKELSGISFQDAKMEVVLSDGEKRSIIGPALFTHFGVSGPAIFAMAAHIAFETISPKQPLVFNFTPIRSVSAEMWEAKIMKAVTAHPTKLVINVMASFLPTRFAEKIMLLAHVPMSRKGAELNKLERKSLVNLLSGGLTVTLTARRPGDEFVTAGGVNLTEVDRKTMRSRLNPNLYFAGEILDIDGLTGGFNLQAAWATGRSAAKGILQTLA